MHDDLQLNCTNVRKLRADCFPGESTMSLSQCPGCYSRMVNRKCRVCGFVDTSDQAERACQTESTSGGYLAHLSDAVAASARETAPAISVEKHGSAESTIQIESANCPSCSSKVSETAINCSNCGFVFTPAAEEIQRTKRAENEQIANWTHAAGAAFGLIMFVLICVVISSESKSSSNTAAQIYTPAQKAVYLDRGNFDVGATTQMQSSLTRLSTRCGMSHELIASKLLVAQELLAKKQVHMTVQQLADSVEAANPTTLSVSFDELLASLVTLTGENTQVAVHHSEGGESNPAETKQKKMFFELVAAQDAGVGDERAYFIIADRYNVSVDEVRQIAVEGATRNWPMP